MKHSYAGNALSAMFYKIGYSIGYRPQVYIEVMFLITFILGIGFMNISLVKDLEYLFSTSVSKSKTERDFIERVFPNEITTGDEYMKLAQLGKYCAFMALPKGNISMLDERAIDDVLKVDSIMRNITFFWNNTFVGYKDLFPEATDKYTRNILLFLKRNVKGIKQRTVSFKYPMDIIQFNFMAFAINLGGVKVNESGYLEDFSAIRVLYLLNSRTKEKEKLAIKFEDYCKKIISKVNSENINIHLVTSQVINDDANDNSRLSFSLLYIYCPSIILFITLSCISSDAVSSKPLAGLAGCLSAALAAGSAFGLLLWCKVEYVDINLCVVFIVLGIGLDDCFVLIASWKKTNVKDPVEKRMAETYSEAAVSITITSLTNILSFGIGITTSYRIIQIFCLYSSVCMLFDYIYQIFLFGGFLALDGYREKYNLHCLFLIPVKPKISGNENIDGHEDENARSDTVMKLFGDIFGTYLGKWPVKAIFITIFIIYAAVSMYFMSQIKESLQLQNVFPKSSKSFSYLRVHYKYFSDYPHAIQVVFNQTLDYSNRTVQENIEKILSDFESSRYISDSSNTICWFREYHRFVRTSSLSYLIENYNINNSVDYINGLNDVFLKIKSYRVFKNDIIFNDKSHKIVASRCFLISQNVRNSNAEKSMLEGLREIESKAPYSVFAHNMWFPFYEQYLGMPIFCVKNVGITALTVTFIFFIFISDLICTCIAAITLISIQITTIGFMSFWNVSFDVISIIILAMSIGICIDYTAHVMYAYKKAKKLNPNDNIKATLHSVGYAIIQGFLSTIIGVSILYFGPSYTFVVFFKVVFLVVIFSFYHGLILIPIILSIEESLRSYWKRRN
ncbi:patched domain-containing protein 3-like [Centruroides vittatus]|uniref:patched domain-containing protein 3-like n=1 Tax=Centruroides vittatus TaxID=120091 RepID=UPI0035105D34